MPRSCKNSVALCRSSGSSSETSKTWTPRGAMSLASKASIGSSCLQGPHQLAHALTSVPLPPRRRTSAITRSAVSARDASSPLGFVPGGTSGASGSAPGGALGALGFVPGGTSAAFGFASGGALGVAAARCIAVLSPGGAAPCVLFASREQPERPSASAKARSSGAGSAKERLTVVQKLGNRVPHVEEGIVLAILRLVEDSAAPVPGLG